MPQSTSYSQYLMFHLEALKRTVTSKNICVRKVYVKGKFYPVWCLELMIFYCLLACW